MSRSLSEKWPNLTERIDFPREATDNNEKKNTKILTNLTVLWAKLKMTCLMQCVNKCY